MITVANRTETAARVKNAFDKRKVLIDELCNRSRRCTLTRRCSTWRKRERTKVIRKRERRG